MINSISIKDFQSHADTRLDLCSGVNVIIGESDAGKSAVLRAINWVLNNRPLGSSFIRNGQKQASVEITKSDSSVIRTRGTSTNTYKVGPQVYTAFGNAVPEAVQMVLNVSDINFQKQHDPYFLVFETPGNVASYIRSCTGLTQLDDAVSKVSASIRSNTQKSNETKEQIDSLNSKLQEVSKIPVDRLEYLVNQWDQQNKVRTELGSKLQKLGSLVSRIEEIKSKSIQIDINSSLSVCDIAKSLLVSHEQVSLHRSRLNSLYQKMESLKNKKISGDTSQLLNIIRVAGDGIKSYESLSSKMVKLYKLSVKLDLIRKEKHFINGEINLSNLEKDSLMSKLDLCPYCGSGLTEDSKNTLIGEMK